jgi:hypothetical protein
MSRARCGALSGTGSTIAVPETKRSGARPSVVERGEEFR